MSKEEFLKILDRRLQVINEKERKDIIDEYRTHIEMKMEEGKTEEEAIEDFGNIDELVDEILDAYKINTDRVHNTFDAKVNNFLDELFDGFKRFLGSFTSLEVDDVVKLIFEIIIILILLAVLQIPFKLVSSLGSTLLRSVAGWGIGSLLATLWRIIIGVAYVVIFVVVLVNLCSKRVKRYRNRSRRNDSNTVFDDFKDSFDFEKAKQNVHEFTNGRAKSQTTQKETIYDEKDDLHEDKTMYENDKVYDETYEDMYDDSDFENKNRRRTQRTSYGSTVGEGILSVTSVLMRIFFCLLMIPFVGIIVGLCCALGAMIVFSFEGFTLIGAYLIVIGGLSVTSAFLTLLYKALWKRG